MRATDQTLKTENRPREALFTPCGAKNARQVIRLADEDPPLNTPPGTGETPREDIAVKTRTETKKPSLYKVFLLNDDYTPMEFVVQVLETFFNKTREEATRIMMHVHRKGAGLCGVYPFDVAETKVAQVMLTARQAQHPLQCTMEKE